MLLPTLQADFRLVESWRPLAGTPPAAADEAEQVQLEAAQLVLPCPLAVLGALGDARYSRQQLAAWQAVAPPSRGGFEERWFAGPHT